MFEQYSAMARSDENLPMRAVLRIDMRVQRCWSPYTAFNRPCASTYGR
jgi:hypothetical protein